MVRRVLVVAFSLIAVSASAQTPYVAGTIGADILRVSHTDSNFGQAASGGSEVWSGSLRVGTVVTGNWGVEFEFVTSGESRTEGPIGLPILADPVTVTTLTMPTTVSQAGVATLPVGFSTETRTSHCDYDAVAWARQRLGDGVDLVYLGGVAFSRRRSEYSQVFPTVLRAFAPVPGGVFRTTVIEYATRPLVGAEARIRMTSHLRLIPGMRIQGLGEGWMLRPYAGLGWSF